MIMKLISLVLICIVCIILLGAVSFVIRGYITARKVIKKKPLQEYYEKRKNWYSYCPLKNISTNLRLVFVCLEDKNFFWHHGFDYAKIGKAVYVNLRYRKKKMGEAQLRSRWRKISIFRFRKHTAGRWRNFLWHESWKRRLQKRRYWICILT